MQLITPKNYDPKLTIRETQTAIKIIKDFFEQILADKLNLTRVSAPFFVFPETGLNDNLNGTERPVAFGVTDLDNRKVEVVHSLAKWKRHALKIYGFAGDEGLYTDMNAIRRDEVLDNLHSIYVDQWDWEQIISEKQRNYNTLQSIVLTIFDCFIQTQKLIKEAYPILDSYLPESITFISSQELEDMYPEFTPKQREDAICKKFGAVFLTQIGGKLKSGNKHDGRSPDYDDWTLNGDMLFYYPVLDRAFEVMSMGIRVDSEALKAQLEMSDTTDRLEYPFHKMVINNELPLSVGGGLGQSRICMYLLNKAHIGEVQSAIWPDEMIRLCKECNINLL